MQKFFLLLTCLLSLRSSYAQTCVGIFSFKLFDQQTKKPVADNLNKNIWYVFTKDEGEFYDDVEAVNPLDSMLAQKEAFNVKHNEQGYGFFNNPMDKSLLSFSALCGLYLVQTELIRGEDTMRLGLYNIPAHQTFQIDSLVFQPGNYFIDLQASKLLSELEFADDKGYFLVPAGMMQPFPKKKED